MPNRAPRVCPRCRNTIPAGPCATCRAEYRRQHGTQAPPAERGYDERWRRSSIAYLKRHPVCVLCGQPSQVSDHYPRTRRELVAAGVPDPDAWHRLRALCRPCHNTHTARTTPGGWHATHQQQRTRSSP